MAFNAMCSCLKRIFLIHCESKQFLALFILEQGTNARSLRAQKPGKARPARN